MKAPLCIVKHGSTFNLSDRQALSYSTSTKALNITTPHDSNNNLKSFFLIIVILPLVPLYLDAFPLLCWGPEGLAISPQSLLHITAASKQRPRGPNTLDPQSSGSRSLATLVRRCFHWALSGTLLRFGGYLHHLERPRRAMLTFETVNGWIRTAEMRPWICLKPGDSMW